jgi:DNA sulfur modification protein DndD
MEAGNLLKEDQLNHVIKENIENVMGFNKYIQLSRVSEHLQQEYAERRLKQENEQKQYRELVDDNEAKKTRLEQLKRSHEKCLLYSANNSQMYNTLKNGKQEEEMLRNKIRVTQQKIDDTEERCRQYLHDLENIVESLEINVFLPHLLKLRQSELSLIFKTKSELENQQKQQVDEPLVRDLTHQIVLSLKDECPFLMSVNEEKIVASIMSRQVQEGQKEDIYAFLDKEEVEALRTLVERKAFNSLPQLSLSHGQINLEIDNLSALRSDIELMKQQISGNDYAMLKAYEDNEAEIKRLEGEMKTLEEEIKKQQNKISQFDIQIQQEPDPKYDTLVKMKPFFDDVANTLLKLKKDQIEHKMKEYLNENLAAYRGVIGRVELSEKLQDLTFKLYHIAGNEIALSTLNAGAKQVVIQVLLKVLHELGDYDPPVMIDTVMGVLDKESRETIMEHYFPTLAEQTILLSTDTEIRTDEDYERLAPYISRTYTLERNRQEQCTTIEEGYFGLTLN